MPTSLMLEGFRSGELSPRLDGQVSLDKYAEGCRRLENFIATALGPAENRPGFRYIASAKNSNKKSRLVPFEFSTTQAYQLEFGDSYIRLFKDKAPVGGLDSYTKLLLHMDGVDASTSFPDGGVTGHTVTAVGDAKVTTAEKVFGTGGGALDGTSAYWTIPDHADFDFSAGIFTIDKWTAKMGSPSAAIPFGTIYEQTTDANNRMIWYVNGGGGADVVMRFEVWAAGVKTVEMTAVIRAAGTVESASVALRKHHWAIVEDGDNWYMFNTGVVIASTTDTSRAANYTGLIKIGYGTGGYLSNYLGGEIRVDEVRVSKGVARWTAAFTPPTSEYGTYTGSGGGFSSVYEVVTTYTEAELPELQFVQSADILFIVHPNHYPAKLSRTTPLSWTLEDVPFFRRYYPTSGLLTTGGAVGFDNFSAANCVDGNVSTKAWDNSTDPANEWMEINTGAGNARAFVKTAIYIADASLNATFDVEWYDGAAWQKVVTGWDLSSKGLGWVEVEWASVGAKQRWRLLKTNAAVVGGNVMEIQFYEAGSPVEWTAGNYPSSIAFFEDRLWLAAVQTLWGSKSGDFYNLSLGTDDADAVQLTISSDQVNKIQYLSSGKVLVIGTAGDVYKASASSLEEALTPLNIRVSKEVAWGADYSQALTLGDVILYITRTKRKIRELARDIQSDSYVAPDMTLLAGHLFQNRQIVYMAYQPEPYGCLWCVMDDGALLSFTYNRAEGITAWAKHTTDGLFESVSVIYSTDGSYELWAVVNRTIGGITKRYIEVMEAPFDDETTNSTECFFVDGGLRYSGVATATITGLDHLNGKTVAVLADGAVQTSKVVSGGSITLDAAASIVAAGLPYTSILQTMRLEAKTTKGTAQGRTKRINKVTARLYKTVGAGIGVSATDTLDMLALDYVNMDSPNTLFTGDKKIAFPGAHNEDGWVTIVQSLPLPCTVSAIIPEVDIP